MGGIRGARYFHPQSGLPLAGRLVLTCDWFGRVLKLVETRKSTNGAEPHRISCCFSFLKPHSLAQEFSTDWMDGVNAWFIFYRIVMIHLAVCFFILGVESVTPHQPNKSTRNTPAIDDISHRLTAEVPLLYPSVLWPPQVMDIKPLMRANIVRLLHTSPGRVNVKARTHEKVDSVGEGRAMACHVVVLLEKTP